MQDFTTPDLFDDHRDTVRTAEAGLNSYGGKDKFFGQAVTVTCPEDNSYAVEVLKQSGKGKVLVIDGFASKKHAFIATLWQQLPLTMVGKALLLMAVVEILKY